MGQHVLGANVTLGRLESGLHGNWVHLWGDESNHWAHLDRDYLDHRGLQLWDNLSRD